MEPITVFAKGSFRKTNSFLERAAEQVRLGTLNKYGREGVKALRDATPIDSGLNTRFVDLRNYTGQRICFFKLA